MLLDHLQQAKDALRDADKVAKFEISSSVDKKIQLYLRTGGYHWTKFCSTDEELIDFAKEVYKNIADLEDMKLKDMKKKDTYCPEDEFVRIYKANIGKYLGDRRQYSQSRGLDALIGTYTRVCLNIRSFRSTYP